MKAVEYKYRNNNLKQFFFISSLYIPILFEFIFWCLFDNWFFFKFYYIGNKLSADEADEGVNCHISSNRANLIYLVSSNEMHTCALRMLTASSISSELLYTSLSTLLNFAVVNSRLRYSSCMWSTYRPPLLTTVPQTALVLTDLYINTCSFWEDLKRLLH